MNPAMAALWHGDDASKDIATVGAHRQREVVSLSVLQRGRQCTVSLLVSAARAGGVEVCRGRDGGQERREVWFYLQTRVGVGSRRMLSTWTDEPNQLPTRRRRGVRRRWEMGDGRWRLFPCRPRRSTPLQQPTRVREKKEDKARGHTDPSSIIVSPPTRRPARKGNRGVGAKPIADVPPPVCCLGGSGVPSRPPQFQCSPTGAMDWATGHRRDSGGRAWGIVGSWERRRRRRRVGPSLVALMSLGPAKGS